MKLRKIDISNGVSKLVQGMKVGIVKHSPEILTGFGLTGMFTATVMAVRATPKALTLIEERKREIEQEHPDDGEPIVVDKLAPADLVKTTWKCYIPAAATGILSAACILGANKINHKRNAALAAAYSISEATLKDYQKKVVEAVGEKKEQVIRDEVAGEVLKRDPIENREVIITGDGNQLCYDVVSCRYFWSTAEKLKKTENILNLRLRDEMYVSLNDFYYELGLEPSKIGNDIGWNIDDGYIDFSFSSKLTTDDRPCLVVNYGVAPRYGYGDLSRSLF